MIYLIGGPPKCGKTTLAKKLAKQLGIRWISSDTLEVVNMDENFEANLKNAITIAKLHSQSPNYA